MAASPVPALGPVMPLSPEQRRSRQEVRDASDRVSRLARSLGYVVTRAEEHGAVTLGLFGLRTPGPRIHLIEIVPQGTPPDPSFRELWARSGLAVPDRVTPAEVGRVLELLVDIERSIT